MSNPSAEQSEVKAEGEGKTCKSAMRRGSERDNS